MHFHVGIIEVSIFVVYVSTFNFIRVCHDLFVFGGLGPCFAENNIQERTSSRHVLFCPDRLSSRLCGIVGVFSFIFVISP